MTISFKAINNNIMRFFKSIQIFFFIIIYLNTRAQDNPGRYLNGYLNNIQGETINYHAPDPSAKTALLVRSRDHSNLIAWETEIVPPQIDTGMVNFVWMFGMDATPEQHRFTLSVNGIELIRFENPEKAEIGNITVPGEQGTNLSIRTTLIDRHKDAMGYAVLSVPSDLVKPGSSQSIKVSGEPAGSNVWYMTFLHPVTEEISAKPEDLVIRRNDRKLQSVRLEMVYLGEPAEAEISMAGEEPVKHLLQSGYNAIRYFTPVVSEKRNHELNIKIADRSIIIPVELKPVRPWFIYFVQHTHTDIGYTRPQSEILPEHLRFIDYALDYCDQTDHFPVDARFRWTCESAWAVEEYLKRRPRQQIDRLKRRIAEGRIEVMAMPFNLSEIPGEEELARMLEPLELFRQAGIPVTTAMQNDVNGIGWCMADYFPKAGVNYLIMGEHGHRALIPFDKPTPFWWESPSGSRMLAYRAEHYMYGNFLLLHTGDKVNFRRNLMSYLEELEQKEYPFDRLSIQYSGYMTDNSPPALTPSYLIRDWNEEYVWPRLKTATASEFMRYIEENHDAELETFRQAWPDWWTDGFGSAARETAAIRQTQSEMLATTGLLSMAELMGGGVPGDITQSVRDVYDNILFYDEHTFGAAESITQPLVENSVDQWAEKSSYVWEALKESRLLREEALGLVQVNLPRLEDPSITVFNTLNWARSGPVRLYIDHEMLDPGEPFVITGPEGRSADIQSLESRADGTYWILWAEDVPPMGYKTYTFRRGEGLPEKTTTTGLNSRFSNKYYSVEIDPGSGAMQSLIDLELKKELVAGGAGWKPGEFIYERLSNRHQLEQFTLNEEPHRLGLRNVKLKSVEKGPVWTSLYVEGLLEECAYGPIEIEYRFYEKQKLVEVIYSMIKKPVTDPEAVYVAFPFDISGGEILFEAQGGVVRPGIDQLKGTASDWNTVQNFVSVRAEDMQMLISSPEIPLFHLGGMNIGKFRYHYVPETTHLYSWVMNNYWTTNFRASQEGELTWRYYITLSGDNSNMAATRFGWGHRVPLIGRVKPPGDQPERPSSGTFLKMDDPGLLLIGTRLPGQAQGIILHIREVAGEQAKLDPLHLLPGKKDIRCREVNVIGETIGPVTGEVVVEAYENRFFKLQWK